MFLAVGSQIHKHSDLVFRADLRLSGLDGLSVHETILFQHGRLSVSFGSACKHQ